MVGAVGEVEKVWDSGDYHGKGGGEADDIQSDIKRAGRTGSTAFEEEEGMKSMNPMFVEV